MFCHRQSIADVASQAWDDFDTLSLKLTASFITHRNFSMCHFIELKCIRTKQDLFSLVFISVKYIDPLNTLSSGFSLGPRHKAGAP